MSGLLLLGKISYDDKVLGLGPVTYWPLDELLGTTANELVNGFDGTYVNTGGLTLGEEGIGDGSPAVLFNPLGTENAHVNIYSAGLNSVFNGVEGSHGVWGKVLNVGIWTDGTQRYMIHNYVNNDNRMYLAKSVLNNRFRRHYQAGGTSETLDFNGGQSDTGWVHWLQTWSAANDEVKLYKNGIQVGAIATGIGSFSGSLHASFNKISTTQSTVGEMSGHLAKGIIFDRPLTDAEALKVGTL